MVERRLSVVVSTAAVLVVLMAVWSAFTKRQRAPGTDTPTVGFERATAPRPPGPPGPTWRAPARTSAPLPAMGGSQGVSPGPREPTYLELLARSETRRRIRASVGMT